jgi:hypothetical protein
MGTKKVAAKRRKDAVKRNLSRTRVIILFRKRISRNRLKRKLMNK